MNFQLSSVHKSKIGTCPHGLPQGACPICSGMGGGGGASTRKADRPAGEMSWDECYAVWQQMLKAKELAQQKKNDAIQAQMQVNITFSAKLDNMAQKISAIVENLTNIVQKTQTKSTLAAKLIAFSAKLAIPVLNIIKNVSVIVQKTTNFIKEKFADISDKLGAIFGELKNFKEKNISDKLKNFKKKFNSIFGLFETEEFENEEKKVEEDKRIFEMKNAFHSIKEKLFNYKKDLKNDGDKPD